MSIYGIKVTLNTKSRGDISLELLFENFFERKRWYNIFLMTLFPYKVLVRGFMRHSIYWIPLNRKHNMSQFLKRAFENYTQDTALINLYTVSRPPGKMEFKFRN